MPMATAVNVIMTRLHVIVIPMPADLGGVVIKMRRIVIPTAMSVAGQRDSSVPAVVGDSVAAVVSEVATSNADADAIAVTVAAILCLSFRCVASQRKSNRQCRCNNPFRE